MRQFRTPAIFTTIILLTIFSDLGSGLVLPQQSPCDLQLSQPPTDPQGYRLRGDRCEGIYIKKVTGNLMLSVVSFTESFEDFDPRAAKDIHIEWARFGTSEIR